MKILSSFTRVQVVLNMYEFLSCAKNKRRYWMCNQTVDGPHWHTFISNYGSQWDPSTVWLLVETFFKIYFFVFSRRTKFMQVWNNLRVS